MSSGTTAFRALVSIACVAVIGLVGVMAWERYNRPVWEIAAQDVPEATLQCWNYRRNMELRGRVPDIEDSLQEFEEALGAECAQEPDAISQRQILQQCAQFERYRQNETTDANRAIYTALLENCPS